MSASLHICNPNNIYKAISSLCVATFDWILLSTSCSNSQAAVGFGLEWEENDSGSFFKDMTSTKETMKIFSYSVQQSVQLFLVQQGWRSCAMWLWALWLMALRVYVLWKKKIPGSSSVV